jgi:hypothetical protein
MLRVFHIPKLEVIFLTTSGNNVFGERRETHTTQSLSCVKSVEFNLLTGFEFPELYISTFRCSDNRSVETLKY